MDARLFIGGVSRWLAAAASASILLALVSAPAGARNGVQVDEHQIKAAFVYNFVKFARWPCEGTDAGCSEFRIGVLGQSSLGSVLDEAVVGKTVRGKAIRVLRFASVEDVESVHLLYVGAIETDLDTLLERLGDRAVLTIGESDRFAERGGAIRLFLEERRMRFEINPDAAKRRGIHLSSELLVLARIVEPGR